MTEVSAPAIRVSVHGLWKLFSRDGNLEITPEMKAQSKAQLLEESGEVLALRDLSFDVADGETFVVMGLSGSGKSTLVRCLIRLIEPTSGEVLVDGDNVLGYSDAQLMEFRRKKAAMVFQHFGLLPHRSVLENAAWGLEVQGVPKEERHARALEVLDMVGLSGWEDYRPFALSGGMQQRVGLARAMAADPDILLMDEPFSGLDPLIRRDMQNELVRLQAQMRKTIIFITHDLTEAIKLGTHIAIMRDGVIVQVGTPEEIMAHPADEYVAEFTRDVRRSTVITVRYLMERCTTVVNAADTPMKAMEAMREAEAVSAFVVAESDRYLGELSFAEAADAQRHGDSTVETAVNRRFPSVSAEDSVEGAIPSLSAQGNVLPVVDEEGTLVGEIHRDTLIAAVMDDATAMSTEASDEEEPVAAMRRNGS